MRRLRHTCVYASAILAAAVISIAAAMPASAAGSAYAGWALSGGMGTVTLPVSGFPSGAVQTNASGTTVPNGTSAYLGAQTPFGQAFGSSQGQPYAVIRPATGNRPSTTTITSAAPTPATGWGFALGDIDADTVRISATGADGSAVAPSVFGWQGAFNYCRTTPRPSSCVGGDTDVPTWDESTGTLIGHVLDTSGATGWFRPTVRLTSITFTFSVLSGNPVYQVWIAALSRTVGGVLTGGCDGERPDGSIRLEHEDGSPVLGGDGRPISTEPSDDGSYAFPQVVPGGYRVRVEPAAGMTVDGPNPQTVNVTSGDVGSADFALSCTPPPPPTTTTPEPTTTSAAVTPTTTIGAGTGAAPSQPRPLAASGANLGPWLAIGALLLGIGACLWYLTRQRTKLGRRG